MSIRKIKKNKEFSSIYNKSKKVYTRYAIIFISENSSNNEPRFGFVASRKTGNAVRRNRIRGLFREFVRENKDKMKKGADYIFVGKSVLKDKIDTLKYEDIKKNMMKVINKWKIYFCTQLKFTRRFFQEPSGGDAVFIRPVLNMPDRPSQNTEV